MPKAPGHINAGRVDRSARLMRIVEVLKGADHPLSAQEIAVRAYDFAVSGKVMLNVSTNIGEIRAAVNREAGYIVSASRVWRGGKLPWHDGRPRYWLQQAPGWAPSWKITPDGELTPWDRRRGDAADHGDREGVKIESILLVDAVRVCKNPNCGKPLPPEEDPLNWCCNDECRRLWRESLFPQQRPDGPQGRLL